MALNIGGSGPAFFLQGFYFFAKGSEGNVSTYSYGFEADRGWDVTGRYYWTVTGVAAVPFVWKFDVSNYSLPNFLAVIGNGAKLSTNLALGKAVAASLNASLASIGQTQLSATYLKATADNLTSEYIFRLQGVPDSFPGGVVELIGGLNGNSRLWAVGLGSQNGTLSTVNQMLNVMGLSLSWKSMLAAPSTTVGSTAVLSFSFAPLNATAPDVWKWKTTLLTPFLQVQQGVTLQIVLRFPEGEDNLNLLHYRPQLLTDLSSRAIAAVLVRLPWRSNLPSIQLTRVKQHIWRCCTGSRQQQLRH